MNKRIATAVIAILFAGPLVAVAETVVQQNSTVMSLYAQLIVLLQEIASLQKPAASVLSVSPDHGVAPLSVSFSINSPVGTESIIFGDGGYSGQTCTKRASGWCDLSKGITHTYQLPGTYTVNVYRHEGPVGTDGTNVSTSTIVVTN